MLSRVFEWHRVAYPTPKDDLIEKRKTIVTALVEMFAKETKPDLFIELSSAVVNGFDKQFTQDSHLVKTLVDAIRQHQQAFPQDLDENRVDLHVVAALTLGEILDRSRATQAKPTPLNQMAASLVLAGLSQKHFAGKQHLKDMLAELASVALAAQQKAGEIGRYRVEAEGLIDKVQAEGDLATFWKTAQPRLKNAIRALEKNAAIDREELDTLWWAYNGYSERLTCLFSEARIGISVVCCGAELADLVQLPPLPRMRHIVKRVLVGNRSKDDLAPLSLKDATKAWEVASVSALNSSDQKIVSLIRQNPSLFPLSWSCLRFAESSGKTAWVSELKKLCGWDPDQKLSPTAFAFQAFNERIAQRLYHQVL